MATPGLQEDRIERLDLGTGPPRPSHPLWWRGALLVAVGAVLGWAAHASSDPQPPVPPRNAGTTLVVGSFQQNLLDPYGPQLVVSLTNTGPTTLEISNVAPRGWRTKTEPAQVPPGKTVDVPVAVSLDCAAVPAPGDVAVVRLGPGGSSQALVLPMASSPALHELYLRRCRADPLRVPTPHELLGTWLVNDGGPAFTGKMFIRLRADGRYEMDAGAHLNDDPGAAGRYWFHDGRLTLMRTRGGDCGPQHRAVWDVGLRGDGLMHIQQLTAYDGFCTVDRGDVWIAERVS